MRINMRACRQSGSITLALCVALSWAAPAAVDFPSSLRPRSQLCQNDPTTVAGTFHPRRDPSTALSPVPLLARSNNIVWCAPATNTYVILQMVKSLPSIGVIDLLDECYTAVHDHIRKLGDGALTGGMFQWSTATDYVLQAWSSNNHQTTWGVLGSAVTALINYMTASNIYGAVHFRIYDGLNEVGGGQIGHG